MKKFINACLNPFKVFMLERQLSEVIADLNGPSFRQREEIKQSLKDIIHKTDIQNYSYIVDVIVPSTTLAVSVKNIVDDDDLYQLVAHLPHSYFKNKKASDFISQLSNKNNSEGRFNIFLLLINHYDGKVKNDLINLCNEMLFFSVFTDGLSKDKTINSKTVNIWSENNKLPLNADIFWKYATFYLPRAIEVHIQQSLESVEKAMSFCSNQLPTFEKYITMYKEKVSNAHYRLEHVKQRDLKTVDEFLMRNVIGREYDLLENSIATKEEAPKKMKNKI